MLCMLLRSVERVCNEWRRKQHVKHATVQVYKGEECGMVVRTLSHFRTELAKIILDWEDVGMRQIPTQIVYLLFIAYASLATAGVDQNKMAKGKELHEKLYKDNPEVGPCP